MVLHGDESAEMTSNRSFLEVAEDSGGGGCRWALEIARGGESQWWRLLEMAAEVSSGRQSEKWSWRELEVVLARPVAEVAEDGGRHG